MRGSAFRDFVERTEDLPVGFLVRGACKNDPGDEVIAAYDAPVSRTPPPRPARAPFPLMLPDRPTHRGPRPASASYEALKQDRRDDADAVGRLRPGAAARDRASASPTSLGTEAAARIADASHFLQEDQGPLIGGLIADWLTAG